MIFNVDAGEGYGNESLLFPYVDAVNISCGSHAGSLEEIKQVMELAQKHNLKIGAHPSYPDRENFGRKVMSISHQELKTSLIKQLNDFFRIAEESGIEVFHIKPHGALYHEVANNKKITELFFSVLKELNFQGAVVGLPNSFFQEYCKLNDFVFLAEVFADRSYISTGQLKPRNEKGAVLENQEEVNKQVLELVKNKRVQTAKGFINIEAQTVCFHGDHIGCEVIIKKVREYIGAI